MWSPRLVPFSVSQGYEASIGTDRVDLTMFEEADVEVEVQVGKADLTPRRPRVHTVTRSTSLPFGPLKATQVTRAFRCCCSHFTHSISSSNQLLNSSQSTQSYSRYALRSSHRSSPKQILTHLAAEHTTAPPSIQSSHTTNMPRGNGPVAKVHYKGSEEDFIVFVESPEDLEKWKKDSSIPLAQVVDSFKVLISHKLVNSYPQPQKPKMEGKAM
jgi:hypothetical protein